MGSQSSCCMKNISEKDKIQVEYKEEDEFGGELQRYEIGAEAKEEVTDNLKGEEEGKKGSGSETNKGKLEKGEDEGESNMVNLNAPSTSIQPNAIPSVVISAQHVDAEAKEPRSTTDNLQNQPQKRQTIVIEAQIKEDENKSYCSVNSEGEDVADDKFYYSHNMPNLSLKENTENYEMNVEKVEDVRVDYVVDEAEWNRMLAEIGKGKVM